MEEPRARASSFPFRRSNRSRGVAHTRSGRCPSIDRLCGLRRRRRALSWVRAGLGDAKVRLVSEAHLLYELQGSQKWNPVSTKSKPRALALCQRLHVVRTAWSCVQPSRPKQSRRYPIHHPDLPATRATPSRRLRNGSHRTHESTPGQRAPTPTCSFRRSRPVAPSRAPGPGRRPEGGGRARPECGFEELR